MAGSYSHLKTGWSLIENMGDASECVEELFWLVERVVGRAEAARLLKAEFHPMQRGEMPPDRALKYVRSKMER
jgi:hypothetical protein